MAVLRRGLRGTTRLATTVPADGTSRDRITGRCTTLMEIREGCRTIRSRLLRRRRANRGVTMTADGSGTITVTETIGEAITDESTTEMTDGAKSAGRLDARTTARRAGETTATTTPALADTSADPSRTATTTGTTTDTTLRSGTSRTGRLRLDEPGRATRVARLKACTTVRPSRGRRSTRTRRRASWTRGTFRSLRRELGRAM